jgi:hypothetical protein
MTVAPVDMTAKSDLQLRNLIENHRQKGKLDAPNAKAAVAEQARRNRSFNFQAGIQFLLQAARKCRAVTYRDLAEAGGVLKPGDPWQQHMVRKIPLSQIVDYAHTHDMPAITALVETKQGVNDSILSGFSKGLADTGICIPPGISVRDYYFAERQRTFDWVRAV